MSAIWAPVPGAASIRFRPDIGPLLKRYVESPIAQVRIVWNTIKDAAGHSTYLVTYLVLSLRSFGAGSWQAVV